MFRQAFAKAEHSTGAGAVCVACATGLSALSTFSSLFLLMPLSWMISKPVSLPDRE